MGKTRNRSIHRAVARGADWLDEAGGRALAALWSLLVRGLWLAARALVATVASGAAGLTRARRWLARQPRPTRLAALAAIALAAVVAVYSVRWYAARPVSVDSDLEALARVIRSEIGTGTAQERLHVAWATRNLAAERGESIAKMACSPCGRQGAGRPVSTRQNPEPADRELARYVLSAPAALDPTGGATHFINPRLQDELAESGALPGYEGRTYRRVRRRWRERYGWTIYYRLGPELEFWGPPRP